MTDRHPIEVALENRLMSHGIYVTDCHRLAPDDGDATVGAGTDAEDDGVRDGTGLVLEYETVSETDRIDSQEVGAVVRTVLDVADERDWSPGRLEATSLTTDGTVRGHWHVERDWFEGLGIRLDDIEFSRRVLGTRRSEPSEE